MKYELTKEQREQAQATANLVVAAMARLDREHGRAAVIAAMRLINTALPHEERRQDLIGALRGDPSE